MADNPNITLRQLLDVLLAEGLGPDNFQAAGSSSKLAKPKRWKMFVKAAVKAASPMQQPQSGLVGTTDADEPKYEISPAEIGVVTASELGYTKPDDASGQLAEDPVRKQPSSPLLKTPVS